MDAMVLALSSWRHAPGKKGLFRVAKPSSQKSARQNIAGQPDTHFGFRQVPIEEKQALVDDVFERVARRYDLMNDLMSGGLHRAWKEVLVTAVNPPKGDRPFALLDVAGGTGDIAFRVIGAGGSGTRATVCDINAEMLQVGRERAMKSGLDTQASFVEGNAEALPFPDKRFDAYTIAFGIRNVPRITAALAEAYRVLKPGSRFLCLEFSTVDVPGLDALYDFYSFNVIPALGHAVANDGEAYRYLVESIRQFPKPRAFAEMIEAAGFKRGSHRLLTGGIVALHSGWRL
jgi:demethylmenaquinone methyltransferase / 2-methoxy-6-polyprenyl-1,4-benzoquinol methylase